MKKALPTIALLLSAAFFVWTLVQPVNSLVGRLLILGSAAILVACLFFVTHSRRWARGVVLAGFALGVGILLLPGRAPDAARLRERYLAALPRYVGSTYVWGGERKIGIDCSGLPRKAMRDALFEEGLATGNGRLIRQALAQWWFDASAQSMAAGYRSYVLPVHEAGRIRKDEFARAEPGDVAITASGAHCLVYLHDHTWIQADPGDGKVEIYDVTKSGNSWFDTPVSLYRWADFEGLSN